MIYKNPILENGADPFVMLDGGKYYYYATRLPDGYDVSVSDDLVHWENKGICLHKEDVCGEKGFWAPEIIKHNGKYYMAFTADQHLGIAVADSPLGPFRQHSNGFLFEERRIDGHFFRDDDGSIYLFYVDCNCGNRIFGARLNETLTEVIPGSERLLLAAEEGWEISRPPCDCVEGPFVLKHNGRYYLTYSANGFSHIEYAVGVAFADSPLGPYKKYAKNPILARNEHVNGTGHHSFTTAKDGKQLICVYHIHYSLERILPRHTCIDKAAFVYDEDLGFDTLKIFGPTVEEIEL